MTENRKVILSLIAVVLIALIATAQPQPPDSVWSIMYGGILGDAARSVRQTSDGSFIAVGWTFSFGSGDSDVLLLKTDINGDTLWTKTYGGSSWDAGYCIAEVNTNGYIIAASTESYGSGDKDIWIIRINDLGDTLWTKTYGGSSYEESRYIIQTNDNGFIIVGHTGSFGNGEHDVYIIKIDYQGNQIWSKTYGGEGVDRAWCIQSTQDDNFIIAGYTDSFGAGSKDVYLIKINSIGDSLWTATHGGQYDDRGYNIKTTTDGGFIITGWSYSFGPGSSDIYLIKTDYLA